MIRGYNREFLCCAKKLKLHRYCMVPTLLSEFIIPFAYLMPESERRLKEGRPKGKYPHRPAPSIAEMGEQRKVSIKIKIL